MTKGSLQTKLDHFFPFCLWRLWQQQLLLRGQRQLYRIICDSQLRILTECWFPVRNVQGSPAQVCPTFPWQRWVVTNRVSTYGIWLRAPGTYFNEVLGTTIQLLAINEPQYPCERSSFCKSRLKVVNWFEKDAPGSTLIRFGSSVYKRHQQPCKTVDDGTF